jgi:hypothetical protein
MNKVKKEKGKQTCQENQKVKVETNDARRRRRRTRRSVNWSSRMTGKSMHKYYVCLVMDVVKYNVSTVSKDWLVSEEK